MSTTMTTKPIRVASICHNEDDPAQPGHRRVRLELHRDGTVFRWFADGEPTDVTGRWVNDAEIAAATAWQYEGWDLRGPSWIRR